MPRPHSALAALALTLCCCASRANDSVQSELSHVVGGALVAGAATAISGRYGVEDRRWAGFMTSVGASAVIEGVQIATNGRAQVRSSTLDFVSNAIGAAFGAWLTDRYLLMPVVTRDADGGRVLGVTLRMSF